MTDGKADPIIENRYDLLDVFAKGEKPKADWRIGTEHEKFVYRTADHRAPSYDEPGGIRDLLDRLTRFGWEPVREGETVIALKGVAPDLPIAVTCDLHANLTERMVRHATALIGYKTYPHVDMYEVGEQVGRILLRAMKGEIRPAMGWARRALSMRP